MHDWSHAGRLGNVITVNGKTDQAYQVATGERIRLRLLNIANARTMNLLFNEPELSVVAVSLKKVKPFVPEAGRVTLAPGQRADLIIDMTADPGKRTLIEVVIGEYAYEVAGFDYDHIPKRDQMLNTPIALPQNPLQQIHLPNEFMRVPLRMEGGAMGGMQEAMFEGKEMGIRELIQYRKVWALNGIVGMPEKPLFSVKRVFTIRHLNSGVIPRCLRVANVARCNLSLTIRAGG
jgi:FtsP/CotA-like multicopper oxidase with cupredoxin domain